MEWNECWAYRDCEHVGGRDRFFRALFWSFFCFPLSDGLRSWSGRLARDIMKMYFMVPKIRKLLTVRLFFRDSHKSVYNSLFAIDFL
jgi:hypothetical protein